MTKTFEIRYADRSNALAGTFVAVSEAEALDLFAQDAGEADFAAAEAADPTLRSMFKIIEVGAAAGSPADDLRAQLAVAARSAQQFGATDAQINFIVSLATKADRFDVLSGGRLTKADASRIIDSMKA